MKTIFRHRVFILIVLICMTAPAVPAQSDQMQEHVRPETWAQPIDMRGVPNLHKVSEKLYRSAQPTAAGMSQLYSYGIKTVVNLRAFHDDTDEIGDIPLTYVSINMKTWEPKEEYVVQFLKIVTNTQKTPVLVHCQHGADRTGTMVAIYRIAVQGWSKQEAINEMTEGGFGFHKIWVNLPVWIQSLDIEKIKEDAGIIKAGRK